MNMMGWLKIEKTTPDKCELRLIAHKCNCTIADAFLAFFKFYAFADGITDNGKIPLFTPKDVDFKADLPGFAEACVEAGWLMFVDEDCHILKWERHNGSCTKARLLAHERKIKSRKKEQDAKQ